MIPQRHTQEKAGRAAGDRAACLWTMNWACTILQGSEEWECVAGDMEKQHANGLERQGSHLLMMV